MSIQPIASTAASVVAQTMPDVVARPAAERTDRSSGPTQKAQEEATPAVSREQLVEAAQRVSDFVRPINTAVQFNVDNDSGQLVVKVIDATTNELIRQVPSEEMLSIAKALDKIQGLLVRQKA